MVSATGVTSMAIPIEQIIAASYPAVLTAMRKPANQWSQTSLMRAMEEVKMIRRKPFGPTLEETLDYRMNPNAAFLATDMTDLVLDKTEVLTAASFAVGELAVPIVWSEGDDVKNPTENQKVALVESLLENGINTHDDKIEQALFGTVTNKFLGFQNVLPDDGQGTPGGVDAAVETWWRNPVGTYLDDGSDIEAAIGTAFDAASKGSGSSLKPNLLFTGAAAYGIYMSSLQSLQRFINAKEADAGFVQIAFRTAAFVFSQYGNTRIYGVNSKSFHLDISKDANRKLLEKQMIPTKVAWNRKIYSALQLTTNNKSRGFVLTQTVAP
ncbi:MAG TPA: phage major capsid protein [Polyangiaceae bacterium]